MKPEDFAAMSDDEFSAWKESQEEVSLEEYMAATAYQLGSFEAKNAALEDSLNRSRLSSFLLAVAVIVLVVVAL